MLQVLEQNQQELRKLIQNHDQKFIKIESSPNYSESISRIEYALQEVEKNQKHAY